MDFEFSPEHKNFREVMRKFDEKEFNKYLSEAEEDEKFPRELLKMLGEHGFLCIGLPAQYGGSGAANIF